MIKEKFLNYFKNIVKEVAKLSTCYKKQVGAIIVKDNRILSTGYNGTPSKMIECLELDTIIRWLYHLFLNKKFNTSSELGEKVLSLASYIEKIDNINVLMLLTITDLKFKYSSIKYGEKVLEIFEKYLENDKRQLCMLFENIGKLLIEKDIPKDKISLEEFVKSLNFIHNKYEVHAEINAINQATKFGVVVDGAQMIVTHKPCIDCAKAIISSGIKEVYYIKDYVDKNWGENSDMLFKFNNVKLYKI